MFLANRGLHRRLGDNARHPFGSGLVIGMILLAVTAHADTGAPTRDLNPETRASVRAVGQAVLRAKRSYTPDPAGAALRENVMTVRDLVSALAEPLPTTAIQIQSAGTPSTGPSTSPATAWQKAHSAQIARLRSASANLREHSRALRETDSGAQSAPSLLDSIVTFFTGEQQAADSTRASIVTPVTTQALTRLEGLDTEIEEVLALPPDERRQGLRDLAASLSPGEARPALHDVDEKAPSPTLSTRTRHRRTW